MRKQSKMRLKIVILAALVACQLIGPNNASLINRIRNRIHQAHDLVHSAFAKLGHNQNSTMLESLLPGVAGMLHQRVERLEKCYSATLGGERMSIFEKPIGDIVRKFIVSYILYFVEKN